MTQNAEFERFTDFLVRMFEKYGDSINQEMTATRLNTCSANESEKDTIAPGQRGQCA